MLDSRLENTLRQVESLRRDLSAEIVLQEEEGHEEEWGAGSGASDAWVAKHGMDGVNYIVDKPRIANPDTQKRKDAQGKLQEHYDSCQWYSARYAAGRALGVNDIDLKTRMNQWVQDLTHCLDTTIEEELEGSYASRAGSSTSPQELGSVEEAEMLGDIRVRFPAAEDAIELFKLSNSYSVKQLVRKTYCEVDLNAIHVKAGKALGYSGLRIWMHNLFR